MKAIQQLFADVQLLRMIYHSVSETGAYTEKKKTVFLQQESKLRPSDYLPITSSDALPLSYRRLVEAKAIKLSSCDKHPAYCLDLNVDEGYMRNRINLTVLLYCTSVSVFVSL